MRKEEAGRRKKKTPDFFNSSVRGDYKERRVRQNPAKEQKGREKGVNRTKITVLIVEVFLLEFARIFCNGWIFYQKL